MNIVLDAMGGDFAPEQIILGATQSFADSNAHFTFVGDRAKIEKYLPHDADRSRFDIVHTDVWVSMEDEPLSAVRGKRNSSVSLGLRLLKEGADALVSAGNTGALFAVASITVRNIPGVKRSAIGTVLPFGKPVLLLDSGANISVLPEYMAQWAQLGSLYAKNVMGIAKPRVGLLNNGTEPNKGTPVHVEAYEMLTKLENINFTGNVEASAVPYNACDVLVTDGFTGNIFLKAVEGALFGAFSTDGYGGAPILGLKKTVIKAHGSSGACEIRSAVNQAVLSAKSNIAGIFENCFLPIQTKPDKEVI